ncbi:uncharacterized protein TNCV_4006071 [Trichonephila clavipes]|nr:uncharacterized protein TNCV_4006071 [Trichonephila clavipes]
MDHVILNHGQVTWTTPELAPPSPNDHINGRTFQLSKYLVRIAALHGGSTGIGKAQKSYGFPGEKHVTTRDKGYGWSRVQGSLSYFEAIGQAWWVSRHGLQQCIPQESNVPDGKGEDGTSELDRIRLDRKSRQADALTEQKYNEVKTGGPRTLQRRNRQRKPQRRNHQRKSEIKLFGTFKSTINIEDNKFMTDIYVIDNSQTTIDVIIGTDVLKQTEFKISANGIELIPKKKDHFINLINVPKAHNQSELKDNALEVLQLKLKNAEDKCKNLEMHVSNTSTLSLEKTALLDKLHKLEETNLEKVES